MFSHDGGMISGSVFMWVFWLILLVLVLLVIRAVVGSISTGSGTSQSTGESPLEILKKRYALGEIDEEEFKRRRRELEQ
jgi:putative membrane protein